MNYAEIKNCDVANGPGVRISLFVSGCTHCCKGCFNQEAWDFNFGKPFNQEVIDHILELMAPRYITGLTLLGGEPFDPHNQASVVKLLRQVREAYPKKSVWAFTGYVLDRDLLSGRVGEPETVREYLSYLDVLVDGPFVESLKDLNLRFCGSSNQRLIDVPKTLAAGEIVLWEDWQKKGEGM